VICWTPVTTYSTYAARNEMRIHCNDILIHYVATAEKSWQQVILLEIAVLHRALLINVFELASPLLNGNAA